MPLAVKRKKSETEVCLFCKPFEQCYSFKSNFIETFLFINWRWQNYMK